MAEWFKAHAWKACLETLSWVRIPFSPPILYWKYYIKYKKKRLKIRQNFKVKKIDFLDL